MKTKQIVALALGFLVAIVPHGFGQTNLQFTSASATDEGAIRLDWISNPNEVYRIEYADSLINTNTGNTTWNTLYDDYPSHGTNTFVGDFGNDLIMPSILHPKKSPMRFYRIIDKGTNSGEIPFVAITSITNSATLSGQIVVSVVATSSLPVITTALYVDGQQMDGGEDGTNYVINTCEWHNGSHTLFATATAQSTSSGPSGSFPINIGRGVSEYKSVNFDNLIHAISFSEPFFEPSLGQTQHVSAAFAANVDWTLQIMDESSNAVRTVTGSGISLNFDWDGTGDGGTNIPDGVYYYSVSAQTNGEPFLASLDTTDSLFSSLDSEEQPSLWVVQSDGLEAAVPLAIYPPGVDTNDLIIFETSSLEMRKQKKTISHLESFTTMAGASAASAGATASPQSTIAPTRPPTSPIKNSVGLVGTAFFHFVDKKTYAVPNNGFPYPLNKVQIEGTTGTWTFDYIPECPSGVYKFLRKMAKGGWKEKFNVEGANGTLRINDLRRQSLGGNGIFSQVNIGFFIGHGSYGTSADHNSDANGSMETYFPSDNSADAGAPWLRLSEFGLNGNLRWMAILACNTLRDQNYNSMKNAGVLPISSNLHLLCGATTICGMNDNVGEIWASKMLGTAFSSPQTVEQAWYSAGRKAYENSTVFSSPVIFRAVGWENTFSDTLKSYAGDTEGDIMETHQQVWP